MNILLQTKEQLTAFFGGHQPTMSTNLLGMVHQGEHAWEWLQGDMNSGFRIIVGFFNNIARYVAFKKRSNNGWSDADIRACLFLIGPNSYWSHPPGADVFDYTENAAGQVLSATGWQTPQKHYCFVYEPAVSGGIPVMPNKAAVDAHF